MTIARILRPQGRHGEVLAEILTDFPEKFAERKRLWLAADNEQPREFSLEKHWLHKGRVVLKFAGIDSITDAEGLRNRLVQIPANLRASLDAGFYVSDLMGSTVLDLGSGKMALGTIEDVQTLPGMAPILMVQNGNDSYDIPLAEEYVVDFDAAKKILRLKLPAGLLDVNAPLSQEEKEEQRADRKNSS